MQIPVKPPKSYLTEKPKGLKPGPTKYVGSEKTGDPGRIASYYFTWDQCLEEGKPGQCWKPERSRNNYQLFHQGSIETAEGEILEVGTVGAGGGHAPFNIDAKTAAMVYADTNQQRFVARLYEDEIGGYFLGSLVPGLTEKEVQEVRRSPLSADFRWRIKAPDTKRGGHFTGYDNIGPWLVTRPGFPLPRAASLAASQSLALVTAPIGGEVDTPCCDSCATKTANFGEQNFGQPSGLQVGVNGFQGFNDGPIGPQLEGMGLGAQGGQGGNAMMPELMARIEQLESRYKEALTRIDELEARRTMDELADAPAPELILNRDNRFAVEQVAPDFLGFGR